MTPLFSGRHSHHGQEAGFGRAEVGTTGAVSRFRYTDGDTAERRGWKPRGQRKKPNKSHTHRLAKNNVDDSSPVLLRWRKGYEVYLGNCVPI